MTRWVTTKHENPPSSFRQVPGLKPAGTSFGRNPVLWTAGPRPKDCRGDRLGEFHI